MNTVRMKKAAKNLDVLVKIAGGMIGACAWVLVIVGLLVLVLGQQMFDMGTFRLDLDYITLQLTEGTQTGFRMMEVYIGVGLIAAGIVCFLVGYGAKLVHRLLASMREGRPFEADAAVNLRKIAWLTLIGGAVLQAVGILERVLLIRTLPMDQIFSSPAIAQVEYSFTFDFGFVWLFCVILFLSYVFNYGQKLQRESDETL